MATKATTQKEETKQPVSMDTEATHIGDILRKARESRKLSLQQVSKELMIRRFYLQAVEEGRFQELPAKVFSIGFVRTYAKLLGLNPDSSVARFIKDAYGDSQTDQPELAFPDPIDTSILPDRKVIAIGAIGAAILIAVLVSLSLFETQEQPEQIVLELSEQPTEENNTTDETKADLSIDELLELNIDSTDEIALIPEEQAQASSEEAEPTQQEEQQTDKSPQTQETAISEEKKTDETVTTSTKKEDAPKTEKPAKNINSRISIIAVEESWVEIKTPEEKVLLSRVLKPGQEYKVPDRPNLTMMTGNAGGIYLTVDGQKIPPLGVRGDVKRNIRLTPSTLLTTTYR